MTDKNLKELERLLAHYGLQGVIDNITELEDKHSKSFEDNSLVHQQVHVLRETSKRLKEVARLHYIAKVGGFDAMDKQLKTFTVMKP